MQIDVLQRKALCLLGILEADALKIDRAVTHLGNGILGRGQRGLFGEHLDNTLCRLGGHGDHDVDHRKHHQRHEDLHAIVEHCGNMSYVDGIGSDRHFGADDQHEHHIKIHTQLHQRRVERHDALSTGKVATDIFSPRTKLLFLVLLARKALYHTHTAHIFLDRLVEAVVFLKNCTEGRHGFLSDLPKPKPQHGDHDHKRSGKRTAHDIRHHNRENQHQGTSDSSADNHHK